MLTNTKTLLRYLNAIQNLERKRL